MGFASYLEDIINKSNEYAHFLEEYNKNNDNKINVENILSFRQECVYFLRKIKSIDRLDEIIPKYIEVQNENKKLRKENITLHTKTDNSDKTISSLENNVKNLRSENQNYKDKLDQLEQLRKSETLNREEFESTVEHRWKEFYLNDLNNSKLELSNFKFEILDPIKEIKKILKENSNNLEYETYSMLYYKLKDIIDKCT